MEVYRLTPDGVHCDLDGLRVGVVQLLARDERGIWSLRNESDVSCELSKAYGFPVQIRPNRGALSVVLEALRHREVAKAQIATLLMRLPDPPRLGVGTLSKPDQERLVEALSACRLLKVDDDWNDKHPRTGAPPNPGWFAPKPGGLEPEAPARPKTNWPSKAINANVREWLKRLSGRITWRGAEALVDGVPYVDAIAAFLEVMTPRPTNLEEARIEQQLKANFDAPRALEELQTPPSNNPLGYERHHVVEQNDTNVEKWIAFPASATYQKFGRAVIDADDNIVWIPRLKHEAITRDYNSSPGDGRPEARLRDYVNSLDLESQRRLGLEALRKYGVLK